MGKQGGGVDNVFVLFFNNGGEVFLSSEWRRMILIPLNILSLALKEHSDKKKVVSERVASPHKMFILLLRRNYCQR